jgi:plastocyanin
VSACSVIALIGASPASAATTSVAIMNFGFNPPSVTVLQGDTVKWTQFDVATQHTSTSDQGFWHSPQLSTNQSYSQTTAFENAGRYGYRCALHPDMTGVVHVPLKASGAPSTGWRVRWSSLAATPSNRDFDVQIKRPGSSTWAAFRTDTTRRSALFNPTRTGTYSFRARTDNRSNGEHSGWSPAKALKIS